MITEYDIRVNNGNYKKFEEAGEKALDYIRIHFMEYKRKPEILGYSNTFKSYDFRDLFDKLISKYGFEIDARSIRHAYGIGNNNEWDILDENLNKVGEFWANNDMYQGLYIGANVKGKLINSFHICSGGFIRD